MIDLNIIAKQNYEIQKRRAKLGQIEKLNGLNTLKHLAGEVIEATRCIGYEDGKEELVDAMYCILTAWRQFYESSDIEECLKEKLEINRKRAEA